MRQNEKKAIFDLVFSDTKSCDKYKMSKVRGFVRPLSFSERQETVVQGFNSVYTFLIPKKYMDIKKQLYLNEHENYFQENKFSISMIEYIYYIDKLYKPDLINKPFYRNNGLEYIPFICSEEEGWQGLLSPNMIDDVNKEYGFYPALSSKEDFRE